MQTLLPSAQSAREKQALALASNTWQRWVRLHGSEGGHIDVEDLRGAAMLGAAKALAQFDESRGVKFSSYAIALIRGEIFENVRGQDYLSRKQRLDLREHQRATAEPWEQQMAAEYEALGGKRWVWVTSDFPVWAMPPVSLDAPTSRGEGVDEMMGAEALMGYERLPERLAPAAEEEALGRVESAEMLRAVSWLPPKERDVVRRHFWHGESFSEIALAIGRSESRAHQIWEQARKRLAQFLSAEAFS